MNAATETYFPPSEPQGGWRCIVPPNTVPSQSEKKDILQHTGVDWDVLNKAWEFDLNQIGFTEEEGKQKSLMVICNGWIAGEWYHEPGKLHKDAKVAFASGTKTLIGTSFARLFTQQKCKDSDYMYEYLPEHWGIDEPARKQIQLKHALTMTSGLEPYDGPYPKDIYYNTIINLPVEAAPGTVWAYNTGALDLLSLVIHKLSGMNLLEFTNAEILTQIDGTPAEIRDQSTFHGHTMCSMIRLTPRDYARIGYLFLNNGTWKSKQLIAPEIASLSTQWPAWLKDSTMRNPNFASEGNANLSYAYTFWLNRTNRLVGFPKDAYMASGGAHKMIVSPGERMIVVRNGNYRRDREIAPHLYRLIYDAVTDKNPLRLLYI